MAGRHTNDSRKRILDATESIFIAARLTFAWLAIWRMEVPL